MVYYRYPIHGIPCIPPRVSAFISDFPAFLAVTGEWSRAARVESLPWRGLLCSSRDCPWGPCFLPKALRHRFMMDVRPLETGIYRMSAGHFHAVFIVAGPAGGKSLARGSCGSQAPC
jgi:hypothetical protein